MDVLIDVNVILDVLLQRVKFYKNSKAVLDICSEGKADGFVAAHSIPTMWYVMRNEFSPDERRQLLRSVFTWCRCATVGEPQIRAALEREDFSDFEDCIQDECAATMHARYIITRNKKDFAQSKIPALLPEEFIGLVG